MAVVAVSLQNRTWLRKRGPTELLVDVGVHHRQVGRSSLHKLYRNAVVNLLEAVEIKDLNQTPTTTSTFKLISTPPSTETIPLAPQAN